METESPVSDAVLHPRAMPTDIAEVKEFNDILSFLKENALPREPAEFERGIVHTDGRLDLCKQGVGPHLHHVTQALVGNTVIKHFLIGNDVVGATGASAIAEMLCTNEMETLYLAGNDMDAEAIKTLCSGLQKNGQVKELWLKRNPIHADGAGYLATFLASSASVPLKILDMDNTGLMDEGVKILMSGLKDNCNLETLYLSANGITERGAECVGEYFKSHSSDGLQNLYITTNRLGTEGAVQLAEGLKNNVNLHRLVLDSNRIGPEGVSAVCNALEHHPSLQYLSFGLAKTTRDLGEHANLINDSCAPAIARIISRAPALRILNLGVHEFTAHGLEIIHAAVMRSSSLISLRYKQIDRPGAQVQKAHSNAHLELNFDSLKLQTGLEAGELITSIMTEEAIAHIGSSYRNRMFAQQYRDRKAAKKMDRIQHLWDAL